MTGQFPLKTPHIIIAFITAAFNKFPIPVIVFSIARTKMSAPARSELYSGNVTNHINSTPLKQTIHIMFII